MNNCISILKNTHILVNICNVNFYILFLFSFLFSCDKNTDIQEIPSYINVSKVNLLTSSVQGSNTHKITDIWVYVNDQFRGTFEIPATIPLLHKDSNNIRLFAGIKDNGISSTRVRYHFYKSSEYNIYLVEDSVINIEPTFIYTENCTIEHENFEGVGTNIDTTLNSEVDFEIQTENGNKFAYVKLMEII